MASLSHLPSILFLVFLYTSINGDSSDQSRITACPSFDCGGVGIAISYPFWHQGQQFEHCGYAGFNISCSDQNRMIYLSNDLYPITNINYSNKSLTLAHTRIRQADCPKVPHDTISLDSTPSLFNSTFGIKMLHFFYNCTLYPPSLPHIACLQYGTKQSYVFMEGATPEFDWRRYCESAVSALVSDEVVYGDLVQGFAQALQGGFKLIWKQPHGACQSCEASGGFCGYNNGLHKNFFCICANGRHSTNCYDQGALTTVRPEPHYIYVAIGALIFGGAVIAAIVFLLHSEEESLFIQTSLSTVHSSWQKGSSRCLSVFGHDVSFHEFGKPYLSFPFYVQKKKKRTKTVLANSKQLQVEGNKGFYFH